MTEVENSDNQEPVHAPQEDAADADMARADINPVRRGVGRGVVFPLFLCAALAGAAGGWALTRYIPPAQISQPHTEQIAKLSQRLTRAETTLSGQKAQLSRLSAELGKGAAAAKRGEKAQVNEADLEPLTSRLSRLEAALAAITPGTAAPEQSVNSAPQNGSPAQTEDSDTQDTGISTEASLIEDEKETSPQPSETDQPDKPDKPDKPAATIDFGPEIDALSGRVTRLEGQIKEAQAQAAAPNVIIDTVLLPPFPRGAVLTAMTSETSSAPKNWLDKTLKKHISVRDPEAVAQANAALDTIEKHIKTGEYVLALDAVEALPSQARSEAKTWLDAVRREVKG